MRRALALAVMLVAGAVHAQHGTFRRHQANESGAKRASATLGGFNCDPAVSTNLLTYSADQSQAIWTKNTVTITQGDPTCGLAPDGSSNAFRVVASGADSYVNQIFSGVNVGSIMTWSVYIKKASDNVASPNINIYLQAPGNNPAGVNPTFSWVRYSVTIQAATSPSATVFFGGGSTFTAADGPLCMWGGQAENGSVASTYIPTGAATASINRLALSNGTPVNWTRATSATCTKNDATLIPMGGARCNSTGCLVEPASTNALQQSEDFTAAAWTLSNGGASAAPTRTSNTSIAPDGNLTADRIQVASVTSGTDQSVIYETTAFTATAVPWTFSCWIKGTSSSGSVPLQMVTSGFGATAGFALASYTTTWARYFVTGTLTAAAWRTVIGSNVGSAYATGAQPAADFQLWGCQVEAGSVPTSYIPTLATASTRNADVATFAKPSWLTDTRGCIAVTAAFGTTVASTYVLIAPSSTTWLGVTSLTATAAYDGSLVLAGTATSISNRSLVLKTTWTGATRGISADGAAATTGVYDGAWLSSTFTLGSLAGSYFPSAYLSNIKLGSSPSGCP